jgi:3-hydroxyisobutyrate dehydrogenase-like beta-hydroxyacid dehydrogenase
MKATSSIKIGFVGLGHMGYPIAVRLIKAGYDVVGYDIFPQTVHKFSAEGYKSAATPADAARDADVVVTMVPDRPEVLDAAIFGNHPITETIKPGSTFIDMSTVDPTTSRELHEHFLSKEVRVADAPVARSVEDAWNGTLSTMVGCDKELFEDIEPLLSAYASTIKYCGQNGSGSAMKLINNFISQGTVALIGEALSAGIGQGLTLEIMLEVLGSTNAANGNLSNAMPKKAFIGDFSAGFMIKLAQKDQRLALEMMREMGMKPTMGEATFAALTIAIENGFAKNDLSALFRVVEQQIGFEARFAK